MIDPTYSTILASKGVPSLIQSIANVVIRSTTERISEVWNKIFLDFEPFMEECLKKNAYVRLISQRDQDVPLYDVYISPRFTHGSKSYSDESIIQKFREGKNLIITGDGGAGKTFFMRHLWMSIFLVPYKMAPIFIELRRVNDHTNPNISSFIRASISQHKVFTEEIFTYFCENGRFCFILDGFDEVSHSHKDIVQRQIQDLAAQFPRCSFAVSSRHDHRFSGWHGFDVIDTLPFTMPQVKSLISKVPFDKSSKQLFLKRLTKNFFDENKSFLSNPLLAILMMMTFRDNMDIPRRMSIFYDQAFTTLYKHHDAMKAYKRQKCLDIIDFQKSFGLFCLLSYHREKYEFSTTEVMDLIRESNLTTGITARPEDIITDYRESVNLLREEGLNYVFIHRSFQEYFCAYALIKIFPHEICAIADNLRWRPHDSVIPMAYEMNPALVISDLFVPVSSRINKILTEPMTEDTPFPILGSVNIEFMVDINYSESDKARRWWGASYYIDDKALSLAAYHKRYFSPAAERSTSLYDMLSVSSVFKAVSAVFKTVNSDVGAIFAVKVSSNGDVKVTPISRDGGAHPYVASIAASIHDGFKSNIDFLNEVEQSLRVLLSAVASWCQREMEIHKSRSDTLGSLLAKRVP